MAHFAKLDNNNKVTAVHVVNNDVLLDNGTESEAKGIEFLTQLHSHSNWKQTSYNGSFRKNFASIDSVYDATRDAFIYPKPYPDWILNEETCIWESPIPAPNDGSYTAWDEVNHQWVILASYEELIAYASQIEIKIPEINQPSN